MIKKFLSYAGIEGICKGLNWLTLALLPFFLNPSEYGVAGLLFAIEGMVSNVSLVGQEKAIFRYFFKNTFSVFHFSVKIVNIFIVLIALFFGIFFFYRRDILGVNIIPDFVCLLISTLFYNYSRLLVCLARIKEDFILFRNVRVFYQGTRLISTLLMAFLLRKGIAYIYGGLITGVLFYITYNKYIIDRNASKLSLKKLVTTSDFKMVVLFGTPLIFHAMSGNILSYADRFFLEAFLTPRDLGIYTFVYSLGSSIFFFYGTIATYFEPLAYKYRESVNKYMTVLLFYLLFMLFFALMFAYLLDLTFVPLVNHFFSKDYLLGKSSLWIIVLAHLMIPFYTIANLELSLIDRTKYIAYSTVISAIANLILNYLLIPKMGIFGAALATLVTYLLMVLIINSISLKLNKTGYNYLAFLGFIFLLIGCFGLLMYKYELQVKVTSSFFIMTIGIIGYLMMKYFRKLKILNI